MKERQDRKDHGAKPFHEVAKPLHGAPNPKSSDIKHMIQMRRASGLTGAHVMERHTVYQEASRGIEGSGQHLPHMDRLQEAFGDHDLSGIQAHVGGAATVASENIGAQAYAMGEHVAFAQSPDLHTAAHEVAHVIQQRSGVQLEGGVGQVGDTYERHADAIADRVVQGRNASDLLQQSSSASGAKAVQRRDRGDNKANKEEAAKLEAKMKAQLDAIIAEVKKIRGRVKTATSAKDNKGTIEFPARNETRKLTVVVKEIVTSHNKRAAEARKEIKPGDKDLTAYYVTEQEVTQALKDASSYSKEDWDAWAGGKSGNWKSSGNTYPLEEVWDKAGETDLTLKTGKVKGTWQSARWFHEGKKTLEKAGFNLTLHEKGGDIVMGFDPKSDENGDASQKMDLSKTKNIQKGAHAGYPFTSAKGHRCIAWVTGQEAFCESLIEEDGKRIKISGGRWGAGKWHYD